MNIKLDNPFPALFVLLSICIVLLTCFKIMDYDIWFEMAHGEYLLQHPTFQFKDVFTFTAFSKSVVNQEWLSEILFFLIYHFFGPVGLNIFSTLTAILTFYVLFRILREENIGPHTGFWILFLTLIVIRFRLNIRPHVISFFFLILFLYYLNSYRSGRRRHLFALPVLMTIWTNFHFGSLYGLILIACFCAGHLIQSVIPSLNSAKESQTACAAMTKHLFTIFFLCAAAALINPSGASFYTLPWEAAHLGIKYRITECLSPLSILKPLLVFPLFWTLLLVYTLIILVSLRHVETTDILIFLVTVIFALRMMRFIPEFALLNAPMIARQFTRLREEINLPFFSGPILNLKQKSFAALTALGISAVLIFSKTAYLKTYEFGYGLNVETKAAFEGVDFLVKKNIKGNIFNEWRYGGYILLKAYPQNRIYLYGRYTTFGDQLLTEYFNIWGARGDWQKKLKDYNVNIAFLGTGKTFSMLFAELARSHEWTMVYYNPKVCIFLRNTPEFQGIIDQFGLYPVVEVKEAP